ncbi:AAA family ATPase [Halomonas sp. ANAO-440]|uniref:AAA family ATPase n=1 Tax=Halomonas sp. ANAO-440 TaxID=2861360 RepID=UPI001CAA7A55|nr:AAA family ATPase [Halomonas sp. ANAO-440]MBZ0330073.1 AAA family ATPase [Halomonas sp. ANAO-440]
MPFINDMLDNTDRQRMDQDALDSENSSEHDVLQSHLAHKSRLESRFKFDVDIVMDALKKDILGQEKAIESVHDILKVVRADITDPRRPLFTALFLGPTGVGKTEVVRSLARSLHGDADAFCRVDMNTLSQEHYSAAITGAPPGYVGAKEGNTLFDQDKMEGSLGRPGIVLFDELEKASPEVLQALLNVFDNGMLTVASGERTYSFRNTLIFMTSNLGARDIQRYEQRQNGFIRRLFPRSAKGRHKQVEDIVQEKLLKSFSPEFVNRIDNITIFNWIEMELVGDLVKLEVQRLNRRLLKHQCRLTVSDEVIDYVSSTGFDRQFGARALRRAVRRVIEVPLAEYLLDFHSTDDNREDIVVYHAEFHKGHVFFQCKNR